MTFKALEPIRIKIMQVLKDDRIPIIVVANKSMFNFDFAVLT